MDACSGEAPCPFCRAPVACSEKEVVKRAQERIKLGDVYAMSTLGIAYAEGELGLKRDPKKATELWQRAADLGNLTACKCLGNAYMNGEFVEMNKKKVIYYFEQAAMAGDGPAREWLGQNEMEIAMSNGLMNCADTSAEQGNESLHSRSRSR